jgi:hypothetical protein
MALNVGLGVSVDNMQDWKGTWEKAGEVNSRKSYITNGEGSINHPVGSHTAIYGYRHVNAFLL